MGSSGHGGPVAEGTARPGWWRPPRAIMEKLRWFVLIPSLLNSVWAATLVLSSPAVPS